MKGGDLQIERRFILTLLEARSSCGASALAMAARLGLGAWPPQAGKHRKLAKSQKSHFRISREEVSTSGGSGRPLEHEGAVGEDVGRLEASGRMKQ